jgi:UDP-2,3-diacylglucosamine pyrophosphatase LpxH
VSKVGLVKSGLQPREVSYRKKKGDDDVGKRYINRRTFLKATGLVGIGTATAALPNIAYGAFSAAQDSSAAERNRLIFLSDLHMNVDANYSWLVDHAADVARFLNEVNTRDDVAELVILPLQLNLWVPWRPVGCKALGNQYLTLLKALSWFGTRCGSGISEGASPRASACERSFAFALEPHRLDVWSFPTHRFFGRAVILGDLLDDWVSPVKDSPQAFAEILAASNNAGIVAALKAVCQNPSIKVTYVTGNHDMLSFEDQNKATIADAFPGMNIISESPGLGAYTKDDVIWAEHGHRYCLFNAPDTWSRTGSHLPMGYFISRLAASKAASTGQVTTTPDLLDIFVKSPSERLKYLRQLNDQARRRRRRGGNGEAGEVGGIFDDAVIIAVFNAIAFWSGNWPWDRFVMNDLDGYNTDPSVEDVAFTDETIFSGWTTRQNRVSQVEAVWNDLGSLASAVNLIFEMPDSLKDKYPFKPRIILFGHTHEAAFQYHVGDVDTIYANTGTWIDSKPMTWAEIQITAGNERQTAYEVSLWFDGERTPRQEATVAVTTQARNPVPGGK